MLTGPHLRPRVHSPSRPPRAAHPAVRCCKEAMTRHHKAKRLGGAEPAGCLMAGWRVAKGGWRAWEGAAGAGRGKSWGCAGKGPRVGAPHGAWRKRNANQGLNQGQAADVLVLRGAKRSAASPGKACAFAPPQKRARPTAPGGAPAHGCAGRARGSGPRSGTGARCPPGCHARPCSGASFKTGAQSVCGPSR